MIWGRKKKKLEEWRHRYRTSEGFQPGYFELQLGYQFGYFELQFAYQFGYLEPQLRYLELQLESQFAYFEPSCVYGVKCDCYYYD